MELINIDLALWCWFDLNLSYIIILVKCILGYKVQSIMCGTNSIFGLKERINSSNSPQLSKDWRGEHKKREVVSRTRKKCYVFHKIFIPAIFKNRPTWQCALKAMWRISIAVFSSIRIPVSCWALLAPTYQQHITTFFYHALPQFIPHICHFFYTGKIFGEEN